MSVAAAQRVYPVELAPALAILAVHPFLFGTAQDPWEGNEHETDKGQERDANDNGFEHPPIDTLPPACAT